MRSRNQNITTNLNDSHVGQVQLFAFQNLSGTFGLTGSLSFASGSGILGTTTEDSAPTGFVGEYIEALSSSIVSWSTGVPKTIASVTLESGSWSLLGETVWSGNISGSSTVFGFSNAAGFDLVWNPYSYWQQPIVPQVGGNNIRGQCSMRLVLTASLTVRLVGQISFVSGTPSVSGRIAATRFK